MTVTAWEDLLSSTALALPLTPVGQYYYLGWAGSQHSKIDILQGHGSIAPLPQHTAVLIKMLL